ncbi:hypothetical protein CTAM01_11422 [Colletotrichum tamarilloi]|uniref:Uncharacterized protein n=1 Tax=Colletotrichum tamarilloi TaxID=1209934 RepID=A0ABQ9QXH7_9PEZI|nr:uncharacterized protein CTAM01_11422 [Colletotrichum tamarilloi]KAK1488199.1 hypothetical protein CTAM01_11422 [Colletotrichum tamarilloi]
MTSLATHALRNERFRDIVMSPRMSPRRSRLEFSQPVRFHARHPCLAECTSRDTTGSLICLDLVDVLRLGEPGLGVLMVRLVARSPGSIGSRPLTGEAVPFAPVCGSARTTGGQRCSHSRRPVPKTWDGWWAVLFSALVLWVGVALVGGSLVASRNVVYSATSAGFETMSILSRPRDRVPQCCWMHTYSCSLERRV